MSNNKITWVVLAGGQASRMGGEDKGLIPLNGKPLIEYVVDCLRSQVDDIRINANRNQSTYQKYGPVFADNLSGYQGPLAGIHASLKLASTEWVGFTPCDSPNLPDDLFERLTAKLENGADIYVAHDGQHPQPVFSVWNRSVLPKLEDFLNAGDRKMKILLNECNTVNIDFSDIPETFINLNTPDELTKFGEKLNETT